MGVSLALAQPSQEQYDSIIELAAEGKVEAAQLKLNTYLEIWPDDADLQAMAKQLEGMASDDKKPAGATVETKPKPTGLSPDDRLEIETVISLAEDVQAIQSVDLKEEKARDVLDRPVPPAARESNDPAWLAYWLARAILALELDAEHDGLDAAYELERLQVAASENPLARKILVALNRKDWWGREYATLVLDVQPEVDYVVSINGDKVSPVETNKYKVPANQNLIISITADGYEKAALKRNFEANTANQETIKLEVYTGPAEGENFEFDLGAGEVIEMIWISGIESWVGKYEISNAQFRRFRPSHSSGIVAGHDLNGDRQPAIVNHHAARDFCAWLEAKLDSSFNAVFRTGLPTASDWNDLMRLGDPSNPRSIYPWRPASEWPPPVGNFADETLKGSNSFSALGQHYNQYFNYDDYLAGYDDGYVVTAPVDRAGSNYLGLHGLAGNVYEWCLEKNEFSESEQYTVQGGSFMVHARGEFSGLLEPEKTYKKGGLTVGPVGFRVFITPHAPFLGIRYEGVPGKGAKVTYVLPGGPAATADIKNGDILSEVQGNSIQVNSVIRLGYYLKPYKAGDVIEINLERNGIVKTKDVLLGRKEYK